MIYDTAVVYVVVYLCSSLLNRMADATAGSPSPVAYWYDTYQVHNSRRRMWSCTYVWSPGLDCVRVRVKYPYVTFGWASCSCRPGMCHTHRHVQRRTCVFLTFKPFFLPVGVKHPTHLVSRADFSFI